MGGWVGEGAGGEEGEESLVREAENTRELQRLYRWMK